MVRSISFDYFNSVSRAPYPTLFASTIEEMIFSTIRPPIAHSARHFKFWLAALTILVVSTSTLHAQDWFKTETSSGAANIRIAVADFKPTSSDAQTTPLKSTFDATLYSDLANAGIFDIVSKSLLPQSTPGGPSEISLPQWANAPTSAAMIAFGSLGVQSGRLTVNGFLFDAKNTQYPQVLAKQYNEDASEDSARQIAHRFADEIIFRLGGGIPGIAETKIFYVKIGGGNKEIWQMDYDGANQHAITHLGTISISPRISPDNTRIAFSSLGHDGFQIRMFSLLLGRPVNFPPSAAPISRRPGLPTARRSPTPPRAPATPRSGSPTSMAASPAASPASAAPTSRPSSIPRPARRSPGSAAAPACLSSTSWTPTAQPSPA